MSEVKKKFNLPLIDAEIFDADPSRYNIRSGSEEGSPSCPFGNRYEWIGYDIKEKNYVRFTKSVFKRIMARNP